MNGGAMITAIMAMAMAVYKHFKHIFLNQTEKQVVVRNEQDEISSGNMLFSGVFGGLW